jgi:asparagine synthase (glutamine-hydrolysing)
MSGIVAVVRLDGELVDSAVLDRMARSMAFRGEGGVDACRFGYAGLGIALPRRPGEPPREKALQTLDGQVWIAADARLDARGDLVSELRRDCLGVRAAHTDGELILLAYRAWGDDCVQHLLGDFAFALWDAPGRRLLCARDPLGVKPLLHALAGETLVVGNTLESLLLHPDVSAEPCPSALADWLVHGYLPGASSTAYAAVHALPPAHLLVAEDGDVRVRRYWRLPTEAEPLAYRRPEEYAEHFHDVFGAAVRDRLRGECAGILLSGGLDSTTVAATAADVLPRRSRAGLRAFTGVSTGLVPDREERYARLAAGALGIPVRFHAIDAYRPFERWGTEALRRPEPSDDPLLAFTADHLAAVGGAARVCLTGEGGDAVLRETPSRLARLASAGRIGEALAEAAAYVRVHGRLPRPGIRTLFRRSVGPAPGPPIPPWLRPEVAREVKRRAEERAMDAPRHELRPEAYARLADPFWPAYLAQYDPGLTRVPVEFRHPFLDLRVVRLVLSIPPAQWYNDKGLIRVAMRGMLPRAVLRRRKSPFAGDLLAALRRRGGSGWLGDLRVGEAVDALVDRAAVPRDAGGPGSARSADLSTDLRPLCLTLWLRDRPT